MNAAPWQQDAPDGEEDERGSRWPKRAAWREPPRLADAMLMSGVVGPPWPFQLGTPPRDPYVRSVAVAFTEYADGDTFTCDVDLWPGLRQRMLCRLAGINAPDRGEGGREEAAAELVRVLALGAVTVEAVHPDKFSGRFDALVVVDRPGDTALIVNTWLVREGLAVPWDGRGKRPLVPWPRVRPGGG